MKLLALHRTVGSTTVAWVGATGFMNTHRWRQAFCLAKCRAHGNSFLLQLRREKIDLENTLEQEQEALVNRLWKRMDKLEAEKR